MPEALFDRLRQSLTLHRSFQGRESNATGAPKDARASAAGGESLSGFPHRRDLSRDERLASAPLGYATRKVGFEGVPTLGTSRILEIVNGRLFGHLIPPTRGTLT